jgi:iron complex transport system permease protein
VTGERIASSAGLRRRAWPWAVTAMFAVVITCGLALSVGAVRVHASSVLAVALDAAGFGGRDVDARTKTIVGQIRLPRVVLGGLVGATLAASGAAYQAVFRNPLADPYLLGAASGAGLGITIAVVAGAVTGVVPIAAFAGALLGVGLAFAVGSAGGGRRPATQLVLAGVAVASFFTAAQTFVQQRDADTVREVYSWILGRLSTGGWTEVRLVLPYVALSLAVLLWHRKTLDAMALGDEEATSLGVHVPRARATIVLAASLGTAAAVAAGGLIGFVGIVVPHVVRMTAGASYRILLPLSIAWGAAFLVLTDVVARTALAPAELPIGVVTASVGAPFFVLVLSARGRA